jgi:hypothetical protein
MADKEYEKFYNQKIGVIVANGQAYIGSTPKVTLPLQLEGILDKETENSIFLKDAHVPNDVNYAVHFKSLYSAVPKDKIISLYLVGPWAKVEKKKIEKELELIEAQEPPKPDSAKSE